MSSDNIKVVVRARPLKKSTAFVPWVIDEKKIYQIDEDEKSIGDTYSYDEVFNVNTKNADIYETAISSLVCSAIEGINLTIFAYGATSSGKTYTMNGIPEDPGIIPRFIQHIFDQVEEYSQRKFLIRVSYVEIYSEVINDLLDKTKKDLKIREDINNCVSYNPKEEIVKSCKECIQVMKMGADNRTVGETQMNQYSSRSHAIFRIVIESAPTSAGENDPVQVSQVNLIDLAGSERASQTGATGQRFKEGAHINKSLTALGLVMKQLVEKNEFVNYRDSKLTRILSNSLGGNAKTLIICNINLESLEDTASTLMFAQRAKAVKNKPKVNEVMTEATLTKKYAKECAEIKKLLESEFEKNKQLEVEREKSNHKIKELDLRIKNLQEIFVKKDPVVKPPKRRHTISTLAAISEERELENASRNLLTVGLRGEEDSSGYCGLDASVSPPRRKSVNGLDCGVPNDKTPTKNLRERLEILTREHEELIEYTRSEKCLNQATEQKLERVKKEYQDLKLVAEEKNQLLKLEEEKAEQMKIDYEFTLETQKKKFERRESELLEQISKLSGKTDVEQPASIENLPIPSALTQNTFEYEEMSEKITSYKKQIEEMQSNSQNLRLENDDLNILIADLRKSVNALELQNSQLKIKNKSLRTKVLDMELKVNNSQQVADTSNNDIDSLKKQIQRLEETNKELKAELGRLRDELFESQDKLLDVSEDLDKEEKKTSSLKIQLNEEKELRQNIEKQLHTEEELRKECEKQLNEEKLLKQKAELELVEEKALRNEAELQLTKNNDLDQEIEPIICSETNSGQEIESKLLEEINLRQKLELELIKEKELLKDLEMKYFEEVELRKDVKVTLCALEKILEQKSQRNEIPNEKTKAIFLNKPKESVSEFESVQDTSEILGESLLDVSDATIFTTPNESMQDIDQDNLESFSSLYFKDSSKSNHFMNFFNSFVSNNGDVSQLSTNIQTKNDEIERNHENNASQLEKLQKDLNLMELQRESDISTIQKLQAQLEENGYMNLSDSEKISKTNKILEALNSLELEKEENLSMIQTLKQQIQRDAVKLEELQGLLDQKSDDLQRKNDEIRMLNEEINSRVDKLHGKLVDINDDKCSEKIALEKEIDHLNEMNSTLTVKIEAQQMEIEKYSQVLKDKETDLATLTEENNMMRKKIEERETIEQVSSPMKSFESQIEEKNNIIKQIQDEKMTVENEIKVLLEEKHNFEKSIESQSHLILELTNKMGMMEKQQKGILSSENQEKDEDLSNTEQDLKKEIKSLSSSINDEEGSISKLEILNANLERENINLSKELSKLVNQLKTLTNNQELLKEDIANKEQTLEKLTKDIEFLTEERNNIQSMLHEEREKNIELSETIEKLGMESDIFTLSLKEKENIIENINKEKYNLEIEKEDLTLKINDLNAQIEQQNQNKISSNQYEETVNELSNRIKKLEIDIEKISIVLQEKDKIIANFESDKINLLKEKSDLSDKVNDLIAQVQKLTNHRDELQNIISKQELTSMETMKENEILKSEKELINAALKTEREKNEDLLKSLEEHQSKFEQLSISEKDKEMLFVRINNEKIGLEEEKNKLCLQIKDLHMEIQRRKEIDALSNQEKENDLMDNLKLQNEIEKLSMNIHDKDEIIAVIKTEKNNLEGENKQLNDKINKLIAQTQTLTDQIAALNKLIENKELNSEKILKDNEMLNKQFELINTKLNKEMEIKEELKTNIEDLEKEKKLMLKLVEDKETIIKEITTAKIIIEKQNDDLTIKMNDLLKQIDEQEKKIQKLAKEYEKLKEENKENIHSLNNDKKQQEDLLKSIEELKRENSKLSLSLRDLSNINNEKANEIRSMEKCFKNEKDLIVSKMKRDQMENEKEKQKLSDQLNNLKATIEMQVIKISQLQEVINEKERLIETLENCKQELEQELKNKEILSAEKIDQVQVSESNNNLVDELKRENIALMEGLEVFQNIKADLEIKLQDLRTDYSEKLGDHITKMKSLLGIKEEKTLRSWMIQQKLETKWEELKNIENQISTIIKGPTATLNNKTKTEEMEKINKKLVLEIQFIEEQKKFLQSSLEKMRKEHDVAMAGYEEKLQQECKKLKAMYVKQEQDKKKIENLEYELRAVSKKSKSTGTSNLVSEREASELKNPEGRWKQQRAEAYDSRRSIDLNTLCSESTAFTCRCEDFDKKLQAMKSEITQLKDAKEVLSLKYEKAKKLCRLRHDEINQLNEKLKKLTST